MDSQTRCIYCKILAHEIPCVKVYEDDVFLGFLDVFPASEGHTLLIPKRHVRWVHDIEPFEQFWTVARSLVTSMQQHIHPQWVQYFTHGALDHAHLHIIPRYDDVDTAEPLLTQKSTPENPETLERIAQKIRL